MSQGRIQLVASSIDIDASELDLRTFPEWEPVEHTVEVQAVTDGETRFFVFTTPTPTQARWYVVLWRPSGSVDDSEVRGGIRLDDGARAWRVFGRSHPEVQTVFLEDDGVRVELLPSVELTPEATLEGSLRLTQSGEVCTGRVGDEGRRGRYITFECPSFDASLPFTLALANLRAMIDGDEMTPFERELVFPADSNGITLESSLLPPPFPDALCSAPTCP